MDNNLLGKIGSKTKAGVKKVTQPVVEEIGEQIKKAPLDVTKQLTGDTSSNLPSQPSPIVEAMQQGSENGELTKEEKTAKARKHIQKVKELEEEIEKERKKKETREQEMAEIRDPNEEENVVQPGEPILPPSPPSRGDLLGVKRKQQQIEIKMGKD